jgi:hypothetical protein
MFDASRHRGWPWKRSSPAVTDRAFPLRSSASQRPTSSAQLQNGFTRLGLAQPHRIEGKRLFRFRHRAGSLPGSALPLSARSSVTNSPTKVRLLEFSHLEASANVRIARNPVGGGAPNEADFGHGTNSFSAFRRESYTSLYSKMYNVFVQVLSSPRSSMPKWNPTDGNICMKGISLQIDAPPARGSKGLSAHSNATGWASPSWQPARLGCCSCR